MGLTDDFEGKDGKTGIPIIYMTMGIITFLILLVCVVLAANGKPGNQNSQETQTEDQMTQKDLNDNEESVSEDSFLGDPSFTSDDLDFWNMYKEDTKATEIADATNSKYKDNAEQLEQPDLEEDLSEDGRKTKVVTPAGKEEWQLINQALKKHTYDFTGLVYNEPVMKYYANGTKQSFLGIDICKNDGVVDFTALKKAGVEFVMIRAVSRGYGTGVLSFDEYFEANLKGATETGIPIGLYVYSQAISVAEAQEEAQTVISSLSEYKISYPIVFDMELVPNDTSRIDTLTKEQITEITAAFCETIAAAGYKPMIYGNKYWFMNKTDLSKLGAYPIWYSEDADIPDYPYQFTMWQYTRSSVLADMPNARLSISFVDYTLK